MQNLALHFQHVIKQKKVDFKRVGLWTLIFTDVFFVSLLLARLLF